MYNSIFQKDLSNNILYDFLNIYCTIENEYYIINKLIYKKYEYNNIIRKFLEDLKEFYKESKQFYLNRDINYNNFLTILRHICKNNNINYYSKIKYDKNKYNIIYYIKIV